MAERPNLPKADAETERLSTQLAEEVASWPQVTTRPMFGLLAFYRGARIFAALPRTRAAGNPYSLLVKLPPGKNPRVTSPRGPGPAWSSFALESASDMTAALNLLGRAYAKARGGKR